MDEKERLAVLETVTSRTDLSVQTLQEHSTEMNQSFSEVKESIIHLRVNSEAMARTQEAIAAQYQDVNKRVGVLENAFERQKSDVTAEHLVLKNEITKVAGDWKSERKALLAWCGGAMFVITGLWTVFGPSLKVLLA